MVVEAGDAHPGEVVGGAGEDDAVAGAEGDGAVRGWGVGDADVEVVDAGDGEGGATGL